MVAAGNQLASVRGQALVLITDGDPNCNENLNPDTCDCTSPLVGLPPACSEASACRDGDRAIDALRRLRVDRGMVTYVVGVGSSSNSVIQTLDNLAIAGECHSPRVENDLHPHLSQDIRESAIHRLQASIAPRYTSIGTESTHAVGYCVGVRSMNQRSIEALEPLPRTCISVWPSRPS